MMRTFLAFFVLGNKLHHLDPNKKNAMSVYFLSKIIAKI